MRSFIVHLLQSMYVICEYIRYNNEVMYTGAILHVATNIPKMQL